MTNGTLNNLGQLGQGQRITKEETERTESELKRIQKRILMGALRRTYWWLILVALLIGPDLGVVVGYALLVWAAVKVLRSRWVRRAYEARLRGILVAAVMAGLGVIWYLYGWFWVRDIWIPVYTVDKWLYVGGTRFLPAPGWLRVIVIGLAALPLLPELALALEMIVELFDSSWPPAYEVRDPGRGPWMPWHKPYTRDESEPAQPSAGGDHPVGIRFMVPMTEHVDLEALAAYGAADANRRDGD